MKTILGKKLGMTQIFDETGHVIPVTVVEAGPMTVTQVKTEETDGYNAVQFGFEEAKPQRVNKPMTGHFAKNDLKPMKHLAEFRTEEGEAFEVGQQITVADFEEGVKLDVTGTSKGKGTQGNIKRSHRTERQAGKSYRRQKPDADQGCHPGQQRRDRPHPVRSKGSGQINDFRKEEVRCQQ